MQQLTNSFCRVHTGTEDWKKRGHTLLHLALCTDETVHWRLEKQRCLFFVGQGNTFVLEEALELYGTVKELYGIITLCLNAYGIYCHDHLL